MNRLVFILFIVMVVIFCGCAKLGTKPGNTKWDAELLGTVYTVTKLDNKFTAIFFKDVNEQPYQVYLNDMKTIPVMTSGDVIKIFFDGTVQKSYPMQITAGDIEVVSSLTGDSIDITNVKIVDGQYSDDFFEFMLTDRFYFVKHTDYLEFETYTNQLSLGETNSDILKEYDDEFFKTSNLYVFMINTGSTPYYTVKDAIICSEKDLNFRILQESSLNQTDDIFSKSFMITLDKEVDIISGKLFMDIDLYD